MVYNANGMKRKTIEMVTELFEKEKIYLIGHIKAKELAKIVGENAEVMEESFERDFGYPLGDMVSIWRLCHARNLLLKDVPYSCVWRLSGFKSRKEMEREWNRLVY